MATIYQTSSMGEAHIRVAFVDQLGKADLLVHRVASRGLASGAALWFFSCNKKEAQTWIFACSEGMAELKVCFVATHCESGWVTQNHRLSERLRQ